MIVRKYTCYPAFNNFMSSMIAAKTQVGKFPHLEPGQLYDVASLIHEPPGQPRDIRQLNPVAAQIGLSLHW
jgi:hypothetical protein